METKTYKIVFSGELAFDTDADEVSAALAEKCGYPQQVIDKILHSKKITIKKRARCRTCPALQKLL